MRPGHSVSEVPQHPVSLSISLTLYRFARHESILEAPHVIEAPCAPRHYKHRWTYQSARRTLREARCALGEDRRACPRQHTPHARRDGRLGASPYTHTASAHEQRPLHGWTYREAMRAPYAARGALRARRRPPCVPTSAHAARTQRRAPEGVSTRQADTKVINSGC